ncbi:MAG: mechanosensitive ion channel family protein, partial [bacterium]
MTPDDSVAGTETPDMIRNTLSDSLPTIAAWLPDPVLPFWEAIAEFPLLGALILALTFFVLALIIRVVVFRSLKGLTGLTRTLADDRILNDLRKPVFTT